MPRLRLNVVAGMRIAQADWGLPDLLVAALIGCTLEAVEVNRLKGRWEIGGNMDAGDPALRKWIEVVDGELVVKTPPVEDTAPEDGGPDGLPPEEVREVYLKLVLNIQREIVALLGSGAVMEFGLRHISRIEAMIKSADRLWGKLEEEEAKGEPQPTETDEIAGILRRMEDRIDDLAEKKYQQLVKRRLHARGAAESGTGVDVSGEA
jgi:hypothetical protein